MAQRGVYQRDDFEVRRKYDMPLLVNNNDELKHYVDQIMEQILVWLYKGKLNKLIVVIRSTDTGDILKRWQFNAELYKQQQQQQELQQRLDYDGELTNDTKAQIRAIMRKIFACVTFYLNWILMMVFTFVILVHTEQDVDVPETWETDSKLIKSGGEHVRFIPLETSKHKVLPIVAFWVTDDE
ncbi:DNA-binding protein [Zychaea mexicana]|uniref:DNA-binding protein n=1 Tax=Zychaea mexicana TaxID=64656 RepID=UPI0022FE0349|nr:DNA-binding protein [Zychaea mexicana]KAI9499018.1 DNA-binding protein [Zychaea mexicana]